jgi:hypothetical protein
VLPALKVFVVRMGLLVHREFLELQALPVLKGPLDQRALRVQMELMVQVPFAWPRTLDFQEQKHSGWPLWLVLRE